LFFVFVFFVYTYLKKILSVAKIGWEETNKRLSFHFFIWNKCFPTIIYLFSQFENSGKTLNTWERTSNLCRPSLHALNLVGKKWTNDFPFIF